MTRKKNSKKLIYSLLALFLLVISLIGGRGIIPAHAAVSGYSSVLSDLRKDSEFDENDFPDIADDYSIQVIQIAEGVNGELFLYTYQPCQKTTYIVATNINMALSESPNGTKLYSLTLIDISGVFGKYKVDNFELSSATVRYYNITAIYRNPISGEHFQVDGDINDNNLSTGADPGSGGNIINKVGLKVGQLWTVVTVEDKVFYDCKEVEVVTVTSEMIGYIRYKDGFEVGYGIVSCDAHFIAFSCDHNIDKLLSADVSFYYQDYKISSGKRTEGGKYYKSVTVTSSTTGASKKNTWQRLSSTKDFLNDLKSDDEEQKNSLSNYDWIINFYETEYTTNYQWWNFIPPVTLVDSIISLVTGDKSYLYDYTGQRVSDVTLMRLEFEYAGKIYNLGVVSNTQTGSDEPFISVTEGEKMGFWEYIWHCIVQLFTGKADLVETVVAVIAILVVFVLIPVIFLVLSIVFPIVGTVLKTIFKGLWWLICLPFRGIKALIDKLRGE